MKVRLTPQQVASLDALIRLDGVINTRTSALKVVFEVFNRASEDAKKEASWALVAPSETPRIPLEVPSKPSESPDLSDSMKGSKILKGFDDIPPEPNPEPSPEKKIKPIEFAKWSYGGG